LVMLCLKCSYKVPLLIVLLKSPNMLFVFEPSVTVLFLLSWYGVPLEINMLNYAITIVRHLAFLTKESEVAES